MTIREAALQKALKYLGVKEDPPDSNRGPLIDQWNHAAGVPVGSPWCMSFVHSMYLPWRTLGGSASVELFDEWAARNGMIVQRPFRGDLVCYDWDADNWDDHVGIVEKVLALRWRGKIFAGWVATVEGNTSPTILGSQADGAGVYRRRRWIQTAKFVRIPGNV